MGILELAKQRGFSSDRQAISPHVVPRKLRPNSQKFYDKDLELWHEYEGEFGSSDPRDMRVMKHFAEFLALGTTGKLDKENELPTTDSVRNKMRRFYSNWQRETHQTIPTEITRSMAPYIEGELAEKLGLKNINRAQGYLTTENFVKLHEKLWFNDHHDYVHEGYRVDNATLLNCHCFTSARLAELCEAKYKDVVFMVGWKEGEPELKLKIQRRICKGKDKNQPEHILYEKLSSDRGPPPLYAQPILFFLANFLSSGAIKGDPALEDMLNYIPPQNRRHWIFEWKDEMLESPIFPEWDADGPKPLARSPCNWSHQASRWAIRAGFVDGCGMHCPRRDSLLKANDSGASIEQVLKYADQQNSAVLRRNYLGSMNTIDGAGCFLGMDLRQDLTEDFRSASMRWIMDLPLGLSAQAQAELEQQDDWMKISQNIKLLTLQIEHDGTSGITREQLKARRKQYYVKRRRLEATKLREIQKNQPLEYSSERKPHEQSDWRHGHFARVMDLLPERKRLSHTLFSAVPLRSDEGLAALRDLIALRKNPCHIAYQDALVLFRNAIARAGYCPVHFGKEECPAHQRLRQFWDKSGWQRHVSTCVLQYIQAAKSPDNLPCPHPDCPVQAQSSKQLWAHLEDIHSVSQGPTKKRKSSQGDHQDFMPAKKFRTQPQVGGSRTYDEFWKGGISCVSVGWISSGAKAIPGVPTECNASFSSDIGRSDRIWDEHDDASLGSDTTHSSPSASSANTVYSSQVDDMSLRSWSCGQSTNRSWLNLEVEDQRLTLLATLEGDDSPQFSPIAPSDELNPTPQEYSLFTSIPLSQHSDSNSINLEDEVSGRSPDFLQSSSVIAMQDQDVASLVCHEAGYGGERPETERLQIVSSVSHNVDAIDPRLYTDQDSQEQEKTSGINASSPTQSHPEELHTSQPAALDADENVWEVDKLLAKWKQGRQILYLVRWKGFSDDDNSWERRRDISTHLVNDFDARFLDNGGNHEGIELLDQRLRRGHVEYLVKWKGRPGCENSWEKASTISRFRIQEFQESHGISG
ncbi:carbonic anhydrase 2 [Fusarium albosuccineum]|uniref:Carbonic anhydrase 2 n=1 Tax=Fusarium albosuccineum TaxID=1237068 RepID=A0A8H4KYZ8_9HYPO|nr:carbonic anhydrase 2 [Fusarium albosuccineum]